MKSKSVSSIDVTPSARRLTESLRDIGYDFVAALADLVDNCVSANATEVDIRIDVESDDPWLIIADNGDGMTQAGLNEALRFGTRREYGSGQLGRYGLGLKTASISQCRRLTVVTRRSLNNCRISAQCLDMDHIAATDRWELIDKPVDSVAYRALDWLGQGPGTVVVWEHLDRVIPASRVGTAWARRRMRQLADRSREYLGMVFHRYLEGDAARYLPLTISVNGEKATPWNPFAPLEERRLELPLQQFEVSTGSASGVVTLRRYVLPPRRLFSSLEEFERLSGPKKWNRQQGLYVYRAGRLIQHGGWSGIRAQDEHTKFARASLEFDTELDEMFQINVAKMRVAIPPEVRTMLERPVHDLCHQADSAYRRESVQETQAKENREHSGPSASIQLADVTTSLIAAALHAGEHSAFERIMDSLQSLSPELAVQLGW